MTLHPIPLNFLLYEGKVSFLIYQCTVNKLGEEVVGKRQLLKRLSITKVQFSKKNSSKRYSTVDTKNISLKMSF
jgi:hypothetical protein